MELLRSQEFTVPRVLLARMAAEAYVRQFWWFILPFPVFGIVLLTFGTHPLMKAAGALGCIWPLTIPFRAYMITGGVARQFAKPGLLMATQDGLYFESPHSRFKVSYSGLRNAQLRHGMILLQTRRVRTIIIPSSAFPGEDLKQFFELLASHGVRVDGKTFLEL